MLGLRTNALPVVEEIEPPTTLSFGAIQALKELGSKLAKPDDTPNVDFLERIGAAVADSLHGHQDEAMFGFLGKPVLHCTSDATALSTLRELRLRWAPPRKSTWQEELLSKSAADQGPVEERGVGDRAGRRAHCDHGLRNG